MPAPCSNPAGSTRRRNSSKASASAAAAAPAFSVTHARPMRKAASGLPCDRSRALSPALPPIKDCLSRASITTGSAATYQAHAAPKPNCCRSSDAAAAPCCARGFSCRRELLRLRLAALQVLVQPRHDLDEIARPRAVIELVGKDAVPAVAARARRARQREDECRARHPRCRATLDRRGADLGVTQHMKGDGKAIHPLVEQRLDRLGRHVAPGEAGAARRHHHIDAVVGDPLLQLRPDLFDIVGNDLARGEMMSRSSVASPIAAAVRNAPAMSPDSMKPGRFLSSRLTQTPERQSACNSTLTWIALASALLPACCCNAWALSRMPSRFWM